MAQAGPYGITQVDVAGVVGNYQAAQQNRIQMMVLQKQMQAADREAEKSAGIQRAVAAYASSQKAPESAPQPQGAPSSVSGSQSSIAQPAAPQHSAADREKLFSTLVAIDPQVASQYMEAFSKMDKAQLDQFSQKNTGIMQIAAGLLQLDPTQRKAALQQAAPELQQYGFTPDKIAAFDPSDQNLRQLVVGHMDAEKIAQFVKPDYHSITQGGSLVETTPTGAHTVYESPTVAGPGGEPFARPPAMSATMPTVQTPEEAAKLLPGTQFKLPDGRIGTVPGGAGGDASGGFP